MPPDDVTPPDDADLRTLEAFGFNRRVEWFCPHWLATAPRGYPWVVYRHGHPMPWGLSLSLPQDDDRTLWARILPPVLVAALRGT